MTSETPSLTGTDPLTPPPGCPAHGLGPGGVHRLYGPDAEDLGALYERLREQYGPVAPVLLHDDVPMWAVAAVAALVARGVSAGGVSYGGGPARTSRCTRSRRAAGGRW